MKKRAFHDSISFSRRFLLSMPSKKTVEKKSGSVSMTKGTKQVNAVKPEKIALSFTANANLHDGGMSLGNSHSLWISKSAMIKCGLNYGDTVIIQTGKDNTRIFCSKYFLVVFPIAASVQLQKGLKDTDVQCSDSLFRCLSPSMSIIPVTVFRLSPLSTIYPTLTVTISVLFVLLFHLVTLPTFSTGSI